MGSECASENFTGDAILARSQPAITCSKLIIETRCEIWRRCGVLIVNFEHILELLLVFLLLTLNT